MQQPLAYETVAPCPSGRSHVGLAHLYITASWAEQVLCAAAHNTYIATGEGWLYLATVIDLYSRRVIGWSLADHLRTELVADALTMAIAT